MALNSPPNLHTFWLPQTGPRQVLELNQDLEIEPLPGTTEETGGPPVLDERPLCPAVLREMLELNDYQVVLVSRNDIDYLRRPEVDPLSAASPAFLLPFSWKELVAGVCEVVRDSNSLAKRRVAQFADVCVDFARMEVSRLSGEVITLTKQEFKTLQCFLSNPERAFSRDELLNQAWGYENYPSTRTVDNHVLKLRQKLESDPARPVHFRTIHGVGYKFVP